jgi:hypothetical protein
MINQCLNEKFTLLISSGKFISLSRFFLVKENMFSFLCLLVVILKSFQRESKLFFLLFEESNENIYIELS